MNSCPGPDPGSRLLHAGFSIAALGPGAEAGERVSETSRLFVIPVLVTGIHSAELEADWNLTIGRDATGLAPGTGPGAGSKLKKAQELGIEVIDEETWIALSER